MHTSTTSLPRTDSADDDTLWPHEVEELVAKIHAAQAQQASAQKELEADPAYDKASEAAIEARLALDATNAALDKIRAPYAERIKLAAETEAQLRDLVLRKWPKDVGKTIGAATVSTRRGLARKPSVTPAELVGRLGQLLGDTAAAKVVTGVTLDEKLLLGAWDLHGAELARVLDLVEKRSLTIRKPTEA
jgi:hypothetical protein